MRKGEVDGVSVQKREAVGE